MNPETPIMDAATAPPAVPARRGSARLGSGAKTVSGYDTRPKLNYAGFAIIGALFLAIYGGTFLFLMERWRTDPSAQHGWLVIPIALAVVWYKREKLKALPRASHAAGLWIVGLALLMHLFEKAVDLNGPSQVSIPVFLAGAVLYFAGWEYLKALAFPIAYLLFMVPIPGGFTELVSFPLRLLATNGSKMIAEWFGVVIHGSGMNIEFMQPRGVDYIRLEVADPCSGLHSLMALKAMHAITAYLTRLKLGWKWVLFMCAIPIALAANLTRIVGIILIGAFWSKSVALGLFHDWSSPMLFAIAFAILISIGRLMEWLTVPRTTSPSS
jgi:exosortase